MRYVVGLISLLVLVTMPWVGCLGVVGRGEPCTRYLSEECDDGNDCTEDSCKFNVGCDPDDIHGRCRHTNVSDGTSCEFDGERGVCEAGECRTNERVETYDAGTDIQGLPGGG